MNMTECRRLYQLEYFNTYRDSWTVSAYNSQLEASILLASGCAFIP